MNTRIHRAIRQALLFPALALAATFVTASIIAVEIAPQLEQEYVKLGAQPPPLTKVVFRATHFFDR